MLTFFHHYKSHYFKQTGHPQNKEADVPVKQDLEPIILWAQLGSFMWTEKVQ